MKLEKTKGTSVTIQIREGVGRRHIKSHSITIYDTNADKIFSLIKELLEKEDKAA